MVQKYEFKQKSANIFEKKLSPRAGKVSAGCFNSDSMSVMMCSGVFGKTAGAILIVKPILTLY